MQQERLLSPLPGMRHDPRRLGRITLDPVEEDVDARRQHEMIVLQDRTVREPHRAPVAIDRGGRLPDVFDPECAETPMIMRDRAEVTDAAEIEVGMEAGGEGVLRIDEHDLDPACRRLREFPRHRCPSGTCADDDDPRPRLSEGAPESDARPCSGGDAADHVPS